MIQMLLLSHLAPILCYPCLGSKISSSLLMQF